MQQSDGRKGPKPLSAWVRRVFRFGVPLIVGYLIITRIDFDILKSSFLGTKSLLFVLGLFHAPVLILIAAYRWKLLLQQYLKKMVPSVFALRQYWIGQALGFFTPASLGLDAYRIAVGGKHFGSYPWNILIVLVEKIVALITCMAIIVVLYPLVPGIMDHRVKQIVLAAYVLLLVSMMVVLVIVLAGRNRIVSLLIDRLIQYVSSILRSMGKRMGVSGMAENLRISIGMIAEPLLSPRFLAVIVLSLGIQVVSSIKSQIYFLSLGYDIPFIVNLFVTPTIYFIFLLPVSLGSIGIREGVYILIYGLFGVPAEIALLVSFYNLLGILLNNAVGGVVIVFSPPEPDTRSIGRGRQDPDACVDGG